MSRNALSQSVRTKIAKAREAELAGQFVAMCRRFDLPTPMLEQLVTPRRKFRFDFCWPETMLVLESQGGLFTGGRHVRGAALLLEHEKMNLAAIQGWRVLYTTPDRLCNYATIRTVAEAMGKTLPPIGQL